MGKATFRPSAATGGGFLDDCDVEITEAELIDGPIYKNDPKEYLHLRLVFESEDLEKPSEQTYTLGAKARENFGIDPDSGCLITLNDHASLNENANFVKLMDSLVESGYPENVLDKADPTDFVGLKGHLAQIPQPAIREGDKPRKCLLFTSLDEDSIGAGASGSKQAKKKKSKKATKKAAKAATETAEDEGTEFTEGQATDKAMELVLSALEANGNDPVARKTLGTTIFKLCSEDEEISGIDGFRTAIVKNISNTEFLKKGPWTYDEDEEEISA